MCVCGELGEQRGRDEAGKRMRRGGVIKNRNDGKRSSSNE